MCSQISLTSRADLHCLPPPARGFPPHDPDPLVGRLAEGVSKALVGPALKRMCALSPVDGNGPVLALPSPHIAGLLDAPPLALPAPCPAVGDSPCTVFLVSEVVNASGGRTGCFLYRGRLLTPAPRSCTPDCCPWPRGAETGRPGSLDDQRVVPQLGADEELCWAELEGQNLTLYLRCAGGGRGAGSCLNSNWHGRGPGAAAIQIGVRGPHTLEACRVWP